MKEQDILENQVNKVYLSLGTNLGKKKRNLELAKFLLNSSGINVIKTSSFYHSKSWPNENFPEYLNIILLVNTKLRLIELFNKIKFIVIFWEEEDVLISLFDKGQISLLK